MPEHFNLPIHLALEEGRFSKEGIQLEWTEFSGGTGQMTQALREGTVDVCILLTEGIIRDIIEGNPAKIISGYITTPLIWGIHTGADNSLQHHSDIYDKTYAISRFGSGSHLMAIVDATIQEKKLHKDQFNVVHNLSGALESLTALESDVFFWEKYTTKPYVDSGQLRRVSEFVTPWPCFQVAATDTILKETPQAIIRMLRVIHLRCVAFMMAADSIDLVAQRYGQKRVDVERWFHATEWATHGWVSNKMLDSVVHSLRAANIISQKNAIPDLVWRRLEEFS